MAINTIKCPSTNIDFVEVLDEPCHKPIIRNSRVNVFVAKLTRNNETMYHRHKENTFYVVIAGSHCTNQLLGLDSTPQEYSTGDCFAAEHRLKPLIHRVKCLDESCSDAFFVGSEILQEKPFLSGNIFQHHQYHHIPKVTIPGCRAYRLTLMPNQTTGYHLLNFSGLFISLVNGHLEVNTREMNQPFPLSSGAVQIGYVTYFDGPVEVEMKNVDSIIYQSILLELS